LCGGARLADKLGHWFPATVVADCSADMLCGGCHGQFVGDVQRQGHAAGVLVCKLLQQIRLAC
jgi:hypothetical protein